MLLSREAAHASNPRADPRHSILKQQRLSDRAKKIALLRHALPSLVELTKIGASNASPAELYPKRVSSVAAMV
jgi:hypothetical protein